MVGMIKRALSSDPENVEAAVIAMGISNSTIWERLTAQEQAAYKKALNSQSQANTEL